MTIFTKISGDSLPHSVLILSQIAREKASTFWAYRSAAWWRVRIERNCTFVGRPVFRRTPGSKIDIGSGCRFLSSPTSNWHGLNRRCMIVAARQGAHIRLGNQVGLSGVTLFSATSIEIGDRCFLGANTVVTDSNSHSLDFRDRVPEHFARGGADWREPVATAPIRIGPDVFIGTSALVLKGVSIGRGAVVGAGSVVVNNVPPYAIIAGNPATVVGSLNDRYPGIEDVP